jgi:hypothetical protein
VLLAGHLARKKFGSFIVHLQTFEDIDKIQWLRDIPSVFHSHNNFGVQELDYVTPIFSVRKNLVEALISHALSNHLDQWHLSRNDQRPNFDPVTLSFAEVNAVIQSQQSWFDFNIKQLTPHSLVAVYEVLIDILPADQAQYSRIYPDKQQLIMNYQQILEYVQSMIPQQMWDQHGEFCDYPARVGAPRLYQYL